MNITPSEIFNPQNNNQKSIKDLMIRIFTEETKDIFKANSHFLKKHFINKILTNENSLNIFSTTILNTINEINQHPVESTGIEVQSIINNAFNIFQKQYLNEIRKAKSIIEKYYEYHNLFKETAKIENNEKRFNIIEENDLETIYDKMQYHIEQSELNKYARSFIRSYKHLINEETINIFKSLKEEELPRDVIQNEIRKIAAFKNSNDLNQALKGVLNYTASYNQKIKRKLEEDNKIGQKNSKIVYDENGITIVEINKFEDATSLGTSQWCICYEPSYYEEYLTKINIDNIFSGTTEIKVAQEAEEVNAFELMDAEEYETENKGKHYFLYNDNVEKNDVESMIAFTIGSNEEIQHCFNKEDESINIENFKQREYIKDFLLKKHPIHTFELEKTVSILKRRMDINSALSPHLILSETRNPLSVYVEMIKQNTFEIYGLFIPDKLFNKSAEDLKNFN